MSLRDFHGFVLFMLEIVGQTLQLFFLCRCFRFDGIVVAAAAAVAVADCYFKKMSIIIWNDTFRRL